MTAAQFLAQRCRLGYAVMVNPGISPEADQRARMASGIEAHFSRKVQGAIPAPSEDNTCDWCDNGVDWANNPCLVFGETTWLCNTHFREVYAS